jgi:hypothetical protein
MPAGPYGLHGDRLWLRLTLNGRSQKRSDASTSPPPAIKANAMEIIVATQPVVTLIAGILILLFPKLLNYIVAIYLIVTGVIGLIR